MNLANNLKPLCRKLLRYGLMLTLFPPFIALGQTTSSDERTVPEALALRLLTFPAFEPSAGPKLISGDLPQTLKADTPLPEGATVLGSLVKQETTSIVADAAQAPAEVLDFYKEALSAAGWTLKDPREYMGGRDVFVMAPGQGELYFCRDDQELHLGAYPLAGGTDLRLTLSEQTEYSLCSVDQATMGMDQDNVPPLTLIPPLVAPEGSSLRGGGRSGGGDAFLAENDLITDLDLTALAEHYAKQLVEAGWQRGPEQTGAVKQVQLFTLQDAGQSYQVVLVTRAEDEGRRYTVYLGAF